MAPTGAGYGGTVAPVAPANAATPAPNGGLLAAAGKLWNQVRSEFEDPMEGSATAAALHDGDSHVTAAEMKKVATWLRHTTTKFGACAAVADADAVRREAEVKPVAEEIVKAFTAAIGTLLSVRRGAGPSLLAELRAAGGDLAAAVAALGDAFGQAASTAMCAGKVLNKVQQLEKVSINNRTALRRRFLKSLARIRDAQKELEQALKNADGKSPSGDEDDDDEDDVDDPDDLDESLEPGERRVVEAIVASAEAVGEALKEASQECAPPKDGDESGRRTVEKLEVTASQAVALVTGFDDLAVHSCGGLDVVEFTKALAKVRASTEAFTGSASGEALGRCLDAVQKALDTVEDD